MSSRNSHETDLGIDRGGRAESEQQRVELFAFGLAVAISVVLAVLFAVGGGRRTAPANSVELDGRVNPNVAPVASLVRLPGIGMARANAIVEYREQVAREGTEKKAFEECEDLEQIHGIGPKTAEKVCGYLKFE